MDADGFSETQFAYLQLGTIVTTITRHLELRIEKRVPDHNYNVSPYADLAAT